LEVYGRPAAELCRLSIYELTTARKHGSASSAFQRLFDDGGGVLECSQRSEHGVIESSEVALCKLKLGGRTYFQGVIRDITRRRQIEDELRRAIRALRVLSAGNRAMIRSGDEAQLYRDICKAVPEAGSYPLAWIGLPTKDPEKSVQVAAASGCGIGYLNMFMVSWGEQCAGQRARGNGHTTTQHHRDQRCPG
jgi:hypothetical protein